MATELHRRQQKEEILAGVASWYNPWAHLAGTTGVGIAVLVLGIWNLKDVRWVELLTIPGVLLFANAFEWRVHKYILHRKFPFLKEIYRQHTPLHHGIYVMEDMEIQSTKEFRLVLIPAFGVLAIVVATGPLAYVLGRFVSSNTGWLFLITSGLYMVLYEITHLTYHLPQDSLIGRQKIIRILRGHHARHHDPKLMQDWNFNVTVPLFDWLLGTIWKPRS